MPRKKTRLEAAQLAVFPRRAVPPPALSSAQIRAARALLGLTQQELADRLDVGHRTLAGWEAGMARCAGETCSHVLDGFFAMGVRFPAGGAGIPEKYRTGGRKAAKGDAVQLMVPAEGWVSSEVMTDDEHAEFLARRKARTKSTRK